MVIQKSNVSARVESTLKRIVKESDYTHKDAYELGAKLIAKGDAEETINSVNRDPELEGTIKKAEYQIVEERKKPTGKRIKRLVGGSLLWAERIPT